MLFFLVREIAPGSHGKVEFKPVQLLPGRVAFDIRAIKFRITNGVSDSRDPLVCFPQPDLFFRCDTKTDQDATLARPVIRDLADLFFFVKPGYPCNCKSSPASVILKASMSVMAAVMSCCNRPTVFSRLAIRSSRL